MRGAHREDPEVDFHLQPVGRYHRDEGGGRYGAGGRTTRDDRARPGDRDVRRWLFLGAEEFFRKVPGVLSTRVGYTGGRLANLTYRDTSTGGTGYAESVELTFNPARVSDVDLLTLFFKMHDPTTPNRQGNDALAAPHGMGPDTVEWHLARAPRECRSEVGLIRRNVARQKSPDDRLVDR